MLDEWTDQCWLMMSVARARRRNQKPTTFNRDVGRDVGHVFDIYHLNQGPFILSSTICITRFRRKRRHHGDFRVSTSQQSSQAKSAYTHIILQTHNTANRPSRTPLTLLSDHHTRQAYTTKSSPSTADQRNNVWIWAAALAS
jgi:hypothetical protein